MNFPKLFAPGVLALAMALAGVTARADDDHHGGRHGGHGYHHGGHHYGGHHGGHYYSDDGHHHGHYGFGLYAVPRVYYYEDAYGYSAPRYYRRSAPAHAYAYSAADDLAAEVQAALKRRGYYRGPIDGDIGAGSRAAIRAYQADRGLPVSGRITSSLLEALGIG